MFLATTALEDFWDKSQKILFLGEWCKLYERRHVWENLSHSVLPYHWDDRDKLNRDFHYLDDVYERYLGLLAEILNGLHKTSHSKRYWRIIIGPWLFYFIEILFDRFESIRVAAESGNVTETWIPEASSHIPPPRDFNDFFSQAIDDPYNQLLFGHIIRKTGGLPYRTMQTDGLLTSLRSPVPTISWKKKIFLSLLSRYHAALPERWNRYVFVHAYLRWRDLCLLQIKLGEPPRFYPTTEMNLPDPKEDGKLRKRIELKAGENAFERLLDELIPSQLPLLYVEGYEDFRREAGRHFPPKPRLIFTANAAIGLETFKFWAAEKTEDGAKLVLAQHGGHHGMGQISAELKHEISVCDRYFTWGWKEDGSLKTKPMPSGMLSKLVKKAKPKKDGFILWVMMTVPRYSYWLYSVPVGPQMLSYLEDQRRLFYALSEEAKEAILIKPYMKDFGWHDRQRLKDLIPGARQHEGRELMYHLLRGSRLVICTYNATTYLETFVADFPTVIFWNPAHWELRPQVKPYFELLERAGILHFNPQSAARKVNEVFVDPLGWWQSPEVQAAKNDFCRKFARTDPHWISAWAQELKEMAGA